MKHIVHFSVLFVFSLCLLFIPVRAQGNKTTVDETSSSIPKLSEFHEVIYVLWHTAYPQKDYELIKKHQPDVAQFAEELPSISLPGILRDKKEKWDTAAKNFIKASGDLASAVNNNDSEKMLSATEAVHSAYEGLVRAIKPLMKELDAYHVVLYKIYHKHMPDFMMDELQKASEELKEKCHDLMKAKLPKRLEKKAAQFEKARTVLCAATDKLVEIAEGKDKISVKNAVDDVHAKYQLIEKIFD